jgi:hypothetical protein
MGDVAAPKSSPTTSSVPPPPTPAHHANNTGVIIGGTVAGVVALLLVSIIACFMLRSRRRPQQNAPYRTRTQLTEMVQELEVPPSELPAAYVPPKNGMRMSELPGASGSGIGSPDRGPLVQTY